ncbi:hypothetical protein ALC60_04684 [Trachymyrmex zeteki]|uniref:Uncharacterized protein n=1 Tax=Mycetomoellerius zeteki TaxID=64791 RepID=A0A151X7Q9_9HYME|nr:hypothetical protein ALC60_04684 [Trachymyrmex zeteki]
MQAMMQNVYTYMASTVLSRPSGFNVKIDPRKLLLYMFANCLTSLYPRFTVEIFHDTLPIEMPSHASIYRAQRIVEQIDIRLSINRPREIDSRSLATGQRYTSIADHCHISLWKLSEILLSSTIALDHENYLHVSSLVIGLAKQYVVPHSTTEKPGFLTGIGDTQIRIVCEVSSGQIVRKIILRGSLSKDYGTRAGI